MTNDTQKTPCIATTPGGRKCAGYVLNGTPVSLCYDHAFQVYLNMHARVTGEMKGHFERLRRAELNIPLVDPLVTMAYEEQSQVYYIRIGEWIKIGYTANMRQRINSLRVEAKDILATEPGGRAKERERHLQFANIRQGRRENFERTADLLTHIGRVRREHGKPIMTGFIDHKKIA
jgi:hypothetical protein